MFGDPEEPEALVVCTTCGKPRAASYMRLFPTAGGIYEGAGSPDQEACVECLEGIKIDGHFIQEWWQMIGRFAIAYERSINSVVAYIVDHRRNHGKPREALPAHAARLIGTAINLLRSEGRGERHLPTLHDFLKLTEKRNRVIHAAWVFPETRADPRDEPDTSEVLEAYRYDHVTDEWLDHSIKFDELEGLVHEAESLRRRFFSLAMTFTRSTPRAAAPPSGSTT